MIYVSSHNEKWIERTREDFPIHDYNGRKAIMSRLWQKLHDRDNLKKVFGDESYFKDKIEEYVWAQEGYRDLYDFLKYFTDDMIVIGE